MLFSEVVGAEKVKETLRHSLSANHVAHAQLFYGLEGAPNLAMALAFATYLNCDNPTEQDACGKCPSCLKMQKLVHPDLHFVYPAYKKASKEQEKHRAQLATSWRSFVLENPYQSLVEWSACTDAENKQCIISVEESREIIKSVSLKAFEGKFKVFIIWLPEMMNISAANSILKVLEEPPKNTVFLLVTNELEKNLTTIQSRCQVIQIQRANDEETAAYLKDKYSLSENEAHKVALLSEGNLNQASKMALHAENAERDYFKNWMRSCYALKYAELVAEADSFSKRSKEFQKSLMLEGVNLMRSILMYHSSLDDLMRIPDDERDFIEKFSKVVDEERLSAITDLLQEAHYHIERNASPKILFMDLSLNLAKSLRSS